MAAGIVRPPPGVAGRREGVRRIPHMSRPLLQAPAWGVVLLMLAPAVAPLAAEVVPAAPAASAAAPRPAPAARPHVTVIEDDGARIEEQRDRHGVRRVVVQSKVGKLGPYEIQVAPAGRDPSQDKGSAGKRTWSVLDW